MTHSYRNGVSKCHPTASIASPSVRAIAQLMIGPGHLTVRGDQEDPQEL